MQHRFDIAGLQIGERWLVQHGVLLKLARD
jgi:hypothetical protein